MKKENMLINVNPFLLEGLKQTISLVGAIYLDKADDIASFTISSIAFLIMAKVMLINKEIKERKVCKMHYKGEIGVSMNSFRITKKMRENASDGKYRLSKSEKKEIMENRKKSTEQYKARKQFIKDIHTTTYALLSKELGTTITSEMIKKCDTFRSFGNGRLLIKYIEDKDFPIVKIKRQKGPTYTFKIVK